MQKSYLSRIVMKFGRPSIDKANKSVNGRVKYHHYGRVQNQPVMFSGNRRGKGTRIGTENGPTWDLL